MHSSLPRHPSPDHLRKQAKMLLTAHHQGAVACCELFRRLGRFRGRSNEWILAADVSLSEAQHALAKQYGFTGWNAMLEEAALYPPERPYSLRAVQVSSEVPIPEYAWAGVPLAVVAALNREGVPVRFMEFAAASGWAFSFGYRYGDPSPA
jgi:hypothetical protein